MLDNFVPNLLIGLREGLEAALIVSILAAYLVKIDRRDRLAHLGLGVLAAVALSLAFGAALTFTSANLSTKAQEGLGGVLSLVAVVLVTGMVFWMRQAARALSSELRSKMDAALTVGASAVVFTAFLAVAREGLETALFLWATIDSTNGSAAGPFVGATVGILLAVIIGWLLYTRAITINLATFFTWTGGALIVVAAGVAAYGVGDLQEADLLPGLNSQAFDISDQIAADGWLGTLLKGIFNFSPVWSWAQLAVWIAYFVPVMLVYVLWRPGSRAKTAPAAGTTDGAVGATAADAPLAGSTAGSDSTATSSTDTSTPAPPVPAAAAAAATSPSADGQPGAEDDPAENNEEDEVMGWRRTLTTVPVLSVSVVGLLVAGGAVGFALNGSDDGSGGTKPGAMVVTADDKACTYAGPAVTAGTHTFTVTNAGGKVTELYIINADERAVGEVENVTPGTSRDLTVDLAAGDYRLRCRPGMAGDGIFTALKVGTAGSGSGSGGAANGTDPRAFEAVGAYRVYVEQQAADLVTATNTFVAALRTGDVEKAKAAYPAARIPYERIEPIAESFGDLDPAIDAREGDVPANEWTGYHVIEKDLWVNNKIPDDTVINKLVADVKKLDGLVQGVEITPSQLGNGAAELLNEVATSKVTGEEERYSHLDLVDFAANVEGARAAYEPLRPILTDVDKPLLTTIDARFTDVEKALAPYGSGANFKLYTELDKTQVRDLSDKVDGLAEPLSKLTAVVVG